MKHTLLYIAAAALATSAALSSCDDNFTRPPVIMPPCVDVEPTATIEDIKAQYWSSLSAPAEIPYLENGDTIIFTGRVCSTDTTGNIYKSIVVQSRDANGEQIAINFSVNEYDLWQLFPIGQEVAVYASGMSVGGYRGLLQFGAVSGSEMTFMDVSEFKTHVIRNHFPLPQPELIDTTLTTIPEVVAAKGDNTQLMRWQSRLIRLENVSWVEAGQAFAPSTSINRYITDSEGNRLVVRCSSYATFKNDIIPGGTGAVTGILSYFGSDWQLLLNGLDGLEGFTPIEPMPPVDPAGEGSAADPYNVARALQIVASGSIPSTPVYVKGIITAVSEVSTSFGNATYTIADQQGGEVLTIYRGKYLGGESFTSADQLAAGAEVVVTGTLMAYNGQPQMAQGNTLYSYNGTTAGGGDTPAPAPAGTYTCAPASSIESGSAYVFVVDGQYGAAIGSSLSFGRFNLTDATITDGKFDVDAEHVIIITEEAGKGYTLKDSYGRYLSMDDSHFTTFQLYTTLSDGCYWTAAFEDGKLKLTNNLATACFVCVSQGNEGTFYTNMAPASAPAVFKLPELYKATLKQ